MVSGFDPDRTHGDDEAYARERDASDPLSGFRERFDVPGGIYLDGNSLGPVSDAAQQSVERALAAWRALGVEAWTEADRPWFRYGESLGDDLAPLVGADPDEVVVANSTTVNVHTLVGTVPVLSAAPLAGALDLVAEAGIDAIRAKSLALTPYLIHLVDEELAGLDCSVGTPRAPARRGGHVAIEHPEAERVSGALRDRGLVVDFRPPNVVRVCPAPLYTRFVDVWEFTAQLRTVLVDGEYEHVDTGGGVT